MSYIKLQQNAPCQLDLLYCLLGQPCDQIITINTA